MDPSASDQTAAASDTSKSPDKHDTSVTMQTTAEPARPNSPDTNCSICLGKMENKSFTDSCFHTFCFVCLLEWSKVKAVCPLCKQPFKSIIHNVRSIEDYDQYHLQQQTAENALGNTFNSERFRYRSTLTTERWMDLQNQEQMRQLQQLQRPTRSTTSFNWRRYRQAATSNFRRRVYASGMRMQEIRTDHGKPARHRDVSVDFFRRNAASSHRLVPWLNRELNVLLSNQEDHVQFVLELILDLIKRFEIRSEEFFEHIQPFTGRRTEHFVHELYSFARCPYDMVKYDRLAVYDEGREGVPENIHTIEDSSGSSSGHATHSPNAADDLDIILLSPAATSSLSMSIAQEPSTNRDHTYNTVVSGASLHHPYQPPRDSSLAPLLQQVRNLLSTEDTRDPSASGWDSPTPGPSGSSLWANFSLPQLPARNVNITTDDILVPLDLSVMKNETKRTSQTQHNATSPFSESSHDSDIILVETEKPWEERTPILLSSDSDEEIEVVSTSRSTTPKSSIKGTQSRPRSRSRTRSRSRSRAISRSRARSRPESRSKSRSRSRVRARSSSRSRKHHTHEKTRHQSRHLRKSSDYDGAYHSEDPHRKHGMDTVCRRHKRYDCHKCERRERSRREKWYGAEYRESGEAGGGGQRRQSLSYEVVYGMARSALQVLSPPTPPTDVSSSSAWSTSRSSSTQKEHRRPHKRRRDSSNSIEVIYEKSQRHSRHKHKKNKKHKQKHHKSHRSERKHDEERRDEASVKPNIDQYRSSGERNQDTSTKDAVDKKDMVDNKPNPAHSKYKKNSTGHKGSKKTKHTSNIAKHGVDINTTVKHSPMTAGENKRPKSCTVSRIADIQQQMEDVDSIVANIITHHSSKPRTGEEDSLAASEYGNSKSEMTDHSVKGAVSGDKDLQRILDHVMVSAERSCHGAHPPTAKSPASASATLYHSSAHDDVLASIATRCDDDTEAELHFPCEESGDQCATEHTSAASHFKFSSDDEEVDTEVVGTASDSSEVQEDITNPSPVSCLFESIDHILQDHPTACTDMATKSTNPQSSPSEEGQ